MTVKKIKLSVLILLLFCSLLLLFTTAKQYGAFMFLPKLILLILELIPKKTTKIIVAIFSFAFSIYSAYNAIGLLSHENIITIPGVYGAAWIYIFEAFLFIVLCGCSIFDTIAEKNSHK